MKPTIDEALALAPDVAHVIVCNKTGSQTALTPGRDLWWDDLLRLGGEDASPEPTSAEDVVMIIYTSGTTGRPKGAVHTHCGFPLKAAMDMALGLDLRREDTLYWMTDMGWMMGPWEVFGTLLLGATMVFYDGAPDFPDVDRLWSLVERHKITTLGVSPTLIRSLMQHGEEPVRRHDLSSLRIMASTGEPWNPEPWLWLFNTVGGGRCPIINYSGGTEISGGIVMGNVLKPLKPCAFSGPNVGMARGRGGRPRPQRARRGRRTGGARAVDRHDARLLEGSRTLHRNLLEPLPRCVGARRLGSHRRRRPVVHPGPVRRHHQGRRQAARSRRGGDGAGQRSRGGGGGCDRRAR